jgi:CRP-like cAMP-binding protein
MPGLSSLALKIAGIPSLASVDLEAFSLMKPRRRLFKKGTVLIGAGSLQTNAFLICSGWAICYRTLPNGERQIINILLPGDFGGLEAGVVPIADRTIEAQTAVTAFVVDANCLGRFLKSDGHLGEVALWSMFQEMSLVMEHLCCVGHRTAPERVCHFLLELWLRLRQIDLCEGNSFFNPLTLGDMAEALGMSGVHMSRTVHFVREAHLFAVDFAHRKVTVVNAAEAARLCAFDPSYLKYQPERIRSLLETVPGAVAAPLNLHGSGERGVDSIASESIKPIIESSLT